MGHQSILQQPLPQKIEGTQFYLGNELEGACFLINKACFKSFYNLSYTSLFISTFYRVRTPGDPLASGSRTTGSKCRFLPT